MTWAVHVGDCRDVLASMPEASVDTVICDPPYGLSFMGKGWDHAVPGVDYWRAALRVAKPGAMLLAFGGTRTFHRLAAAIEDAGWEVRDCLSWLYGSGFPKSLDISKAIDKAAGAERTDVIGVKPGHEEFVARTDASGGGTRADGWDRPWKDDPEAVKRSHMVTAPATDAAKRWHGWGTALKPAWEPIILAMKPLDGTFAENAQRHGVAGLAIDAGRVDGGARPARVKLGGASSGIYGDGLNNSRARGVPDTTTGRFPANVLLDEVAAAALDEQSGDLAAGWSPGSRGGIGFNGSAQGTSEGRPHEKLDAGGASRFFYVAKAARAERGVGNDHPTVKPVDLMRYLARLTRTPSGGVVLDPFCGSGSTGVGAMLEGRDFIGIELDPHNAAIARQRVSEADPIGKQVDLLTVLAEGETSS